MSRPAELVLHDLTVERGRRTVLAGVAATLAGGGITAVVGPNGAGKSSLLGAVAGVLPCRGAVRLDGCASVPGASAYMPQAAAVRASLSVLEVVLLGRLERLGWRLAAVDLEAALAALAALDLTPLAGARIDALSGGQQQLVLLAQRLVRRPRLLLLDEPTSALDLSRQLVVLERLALYARESGAVVLMALHDLSLAARYASHLLLLKQGVLAAAGPPAQVLTPAAIAAAYGVEAEVLRSSLGHAAIAPLRACRRS